MISHPRAGARLCSPEAPWQPGGDSLTRHLASMDETEVKRILDDRLFSGPSRMEPIADAIRRVSRK